MSMERNNIDTKRERRLACNEVIRQRNKAKARENEYKPRRFITTVVMNPMKESDIVYENGNYWVARERDRYTVYQSGATHSISDSSYGKSKDGLTLAIARCDYLARLCPSTRY